MSEKLAPIVELVNNEREDSSKHETAVMRMVGGLITQRVCCHELWDETVQCIHRY